MRKTYVITGINTAISLLRPEAKYCLQNTNFIEWNDQRPAPTWDEIMKLSQKLESLKIQFLLLN